MILAKAVDSSVSPAMMSISSLDDSRIVDAAEFRKLLTSRRRMVRVDRRSERLRGIRDLDTGEVFFTDERRLLEAGR
jgi:hypothetical protein